MLPQELIFVYVLMSIFVLDCLHESFYVSLVVALLREITAIDINGLHSLAGLEPIFRKQRAI